METPQDEYEKLLDDYDNLQKITEQLELQQYAIEEHYKGEIKHIEDYVAFLEKQSIGEEKLIVRLQKENSLLHQAIKALATPQEYELIVREIKDGNE